MTGREGGGEEEEREREGERGSVHVWDDDEEEKEEEEGGEGVRGQWKEERGGGPPFGELYVLWSKKAERGEKRRKSG